MAETKDPGRRKFPRARERIPVRLKMQDGKKAFEATVHSTDISLSGIFFSSTFFLRTGTVLDLEFTMPNDDRLVRVRGVIVREVRLDDARKRGSGKRQAGFAMRFVEYHADAKTILASSFLIASLDDFLRDYIQRRSRKPKSELEGLRDVLIAWEVAQMELKGGELDIMRDRISVDSEGRIRRRKGSRK